MAQRSSRRGLASLCEFEQENISTTSEQPISDESTKQQDRSVDAPHPEWCCLFKPRWHSTIRGQILVQIRAHKLFVHKPSDDIHFFSFFSFFLSLSLFFSFIPSFLPFF